MANNSEEKGRLTPEDVVISPVEEQDLISIVGPLTLLRGCFLQTIGKHHEF
jgi:hypothetical protein